MKRKKRKKTERKHGRKHGRKRKENTEKNGKNGRKRQENTEKNGRNRKRHRSGDPFCETPGHTAHVFARHEGKHRGATFSGTAPPLFEIAEQGFNNFGRNWQQRKWNSCIFRATSQCAVCKKSWQTCAAEETFWILQYRKITQERFVI